MRLENQAQSPSKSIPLQLSDVYRIDSLDDEALIPVAGPFIYAARCREGRKELLRRTNNWKVLEEYDFQVTMRKIGLFLENVAVVGAFAYGAIRMLT